MYSKNNGAQGQSKANTEGKATLNNPRVHKPSKVPKKRVYIDHRLCPYWQIRTEILMGFAIERGMSDSLANSSKRPEIVAFLKKNDRETCVYLKFTKNYLRDFAHNRNLGHVRSHACKQELIDILEKADREWTFSFMALPSELRMAICTFAVIDPNQTLNRKQPNITKVSKLVRKESLPIFYATNRFSVSVCDCNDARNETGDRHLSSSSLTHFMALGGRNISSIKDLQIHLTVLYMIDNRSYGALNVTLRFQYPKANLSQLGFNNIIAEIDISDPGEDDELEPMLDMNNMKKQDVVCALFHEFCNKALQPLSRRLTLRGLATFVKGIPRDVTKMAIECGLAGCKAHPKQSRLI